jgi:hypothetical protein
MKKYNLSFNVLFIDNSTRNNDDELYTMDSQTTSRNSPSEMIETSNDSDIGNNSFPTSNLLSKVIRKLYINTFTICKE